MDQSLQYCEFILQNTKNNNTRVIAFTILENFIKQKWNLLDDVGKVNLRNFLVSILINFVTDDNFYNNSQNTFVINKLNLLVVQIAKNEWTSSWKNFISEICNSSKNNQNLCENNMKILILLSDEINECWKSSLTFKKAQELREKMKTEFIEVFNLCQLIINNSTAVKQNLLTQALKLFGEYTNWFPLNLALNKDLLYKILMNFKDLVFCRTETMKCLSGLFGIKILPETFSNKNDYSQCRELLMQMFQAFINIMDIQVVKGKNFAEQYKNLLNNNPEKITGYEKMTFNFEMCLINFIKENFSYIQQNDFIEGTKRPNDFINNYIKQISSSLNYLAQFISIESEEIFKVAIDFWLWFSYKIFTLLDPNDTLDNYNINSNIRQKYSKSQYLQYLNDSYLYKNAYMKIIDIVRGIICIKMTKPLEVKIDIDENGDIVCDPTTNTVYQSIHENMRDTLVYLTYIDPYKTQTLLQAKINEQLDIAKQNNKINPSLLNSISWSAGCISGAMTESIEVSFLVVFIKVLLGLCEIIKGKGNKAICASNIMYVVGQYPRFLNGHWKFLKTVVKKLFEFMHESFEGVQDFACETFMKISMKCSYNFTKTQDKENEPYLAELVRTVYDNTKDLKQHQQLMFYEAVGNMINMEPNLQEKIFYIKSLMSDKHNQWSQIFSKAKMNTVLLNNIEVVKGLGLIVHVNERVCHATKTPYWYYGSMIFQDMINSFLYYSNIINEHLNNNKPIDVNIRTYILYNRTLIKFFTSLVKNIDNNEIIKNELLESFGKILEAYNASNVNNRDPNMLLLFREILEKLGNTDPNIVAIIWNYLFVNTLKLLINDFQSFPEHRINFFILLKSLISNSFESLFKTQNLFFNKDVIDTITFAVKHNAPNMSETGLETLLILLEKVIKVPFIDGNDIMNPFFENYFYIIFNDVFNAMTDGFHQSGYKLQVKIIQILMQVVDSGKLKEGILCKGQENKKYFLTKLLNDLLSSFGNITQTQGEAFCLALLNNCNDYHKFKSIMRDFLISLKSFIGNNEALWEEEKKKELEIANQIEMQKKQFLPTPQYDTNINANNYQDNNMM